MIVMETKFTTFAVFRANEGETSPPGDGKSTSCEISSGRWIPIETKKSRDPKRNNATIASTRQSVERMLWLGTE